MISDNSGDSGNVKISDEAAAVCAAKAALATSGVHSLTSGITSAITDNILGKPHEARGVKVSRSNGIIDVDLHIVVENGVKIPSVAWSIQENVKKSLEEFTGNTVNSINVHVSGIHFTEEEQ